MAHEISTINGRSEAFFSLAPAWHGLGTVLPTVATSEQAIEAAHLGWRVEKRPLFLADGREVPDNFATVRADTGDPLGVVGDRYSVVQNREAFSFLDGLLQDGIMKYESAGALRGGRIIWILARMPSVDTIAEGDQTCRYLLWKTAHDGSAALEVLPTAVRVVCANTLRLALDNRQNGISFRHTGDMKAKLNAARVILSQFDKRFTLYSEQARHLAETKWTDEKAREYIAALFPEVKEFGRSRSIRENKVAQVRANMRNERNSLRSIKGSWWQLFNAVTESVDHDSRKGLKTAAHRENHFLSTIDGAGADFKAEAFNFALMLAG
jgi:phage/plasmid-like protein (TIGR03299 family)